MDWAVREKDRDTTIRELTEEAVKYIRQLDDGYEITTGRIVGKILRHKGYVATHG